MMNVIGVRFADSPAKANYYAVDKNDKYVMNDKVVVNSSRGLELALVAITTKEIDDTKFERDIEKIVRRATQKDIEQAEENEKKAIEAVQIAQEKAVAHELEMNFLHAHWTLDKSKLVLFFTAEGRVDFRELVKTLATIFKTRIELRQVGVRDVAQMLGGLGICGRPLCCNAFKNGFDAVSVKMAKDQNLSPNPSKISGVCGRLMCCLKYEQDGYEELLKGLPDVGDEVRLKSGEKARVQEVFILKQMVKVRIGEGGLTAILPVSDVKISAHSKGKQEETEV